MFPAPPVVAVTIGRTAPALATCTVPATSKSTCQCQHRAHICHHVRAGSEGNRSRRRADEGLDQIVEVINRRDFIRQHLDDDQHA